MLSSCYLSAAKKTLVKLKRRRKSRCYQHIGSDEQWNRSRGGDAVALHDLSKRAENVNTYPLSRYFETNMV